MNNGSPGGELRLAIVGMSARLPGADSLDAFWQNLREGVESITFFSKEELIATALDPALVSRPNYIPARAILAEVEKFDSAFFGLSPREAALLDPQQRILLECAWEALDSSGCARDAELRPCGVYAGVGMNGYLLHNIWGNRTILDSTDGFQAMLGNDKDFCATRISYKLNLKGPSIAVQTACSSSLVAVHLACQALLQGECDLAIAGGCAAFVPQRSGYLYEPGMIFSPDGHCRPFDSSAAGTVAGSGAGMIVLKRLEDALADGDGIYAVILGSAINNDGALKIGYTAPSVEGQRAVISEALAVAGATPDSIGFIEAHGTGTPQGDPIEFDALVRIFGSVGTRNGRCALGSVKSNFGHLDAAAGIAGLIKAVLALRNGLIPGTLHFERPNPAIDLENSPFFVPTKPVPWDMLRSSQRRAGVSSFGIGGTNAHVVLEEAPLGKAAKRSRRYHAFVLSAKSETALRAASQNLAKHLEATPNCEIADVAFSLNAGRRLFAHRRVIRAADGAAAVKQLREAPAAEDSRDDDSRYRDVVFLFPGQGTQHPHMARGLYETEPLFRKEIDRCADILGLALGSDLRDVLFTKDSAGAAEIHQTRFAQPALFSVEYSISQCLIGWNVHPRAMMGHSMGEWVAACVAEVMSLEDALQVIALRARLMQEQPGGTLLGVHLGEKALNPYLSQEIALAAVNGPQLCAVSGSFDAIAALEGHLEGEGITTRRLVTSHAFHSAMMDPVIEPLNEAMNRIKLQAPRIRFVSNVTGRWITAEEATDPRYWSRHMREPVRCAEGLELLFRDPDQLLLEVGPGKMFATLALQNPARSEEQAVFQTFPSSRRPEEEAQHLATLAARLHMAGVPLDWKAFHAGEGRRNIWLPAHPFRRERCWIDPVAAGNQLLVTPPMPEPSEKRRNFSEWFYQPGWRRSLPPQPNAAASCTGTWLLIGGSLRADGEGVDLPHSLAKRLREGGAGILQVSFGERFTASSSAEYMVRRTNADDWRQVLADIRRRDLPLRGILIFDNDRGAERFNDSDSAAALNDGSFYQDLLQLIAIVQSIGLTRQSEAVELILITRDLHSIGGTEQLEPQHALALGALRVIQQEYRGVKSRNIDVDAASFRDGSQAAGRVLAEILSDSEDDVVSYRSAVRWVPSFEQIKIAGGARAPRLRERGVYLITGGLGGIGLTLAKHLAESDRARLILVSRSEFPDRCEWERLSEEPNTRAGRRARALLEIESAGGEVLIVQADVADEEQMADIAARGERHFGSINGIIHAAGIPGGGVLAGKTPHAVQAVLRGKVEGVRVLDRIFEQRELDFTVLCSSVTAWLGGFGQADYCAANAFLDAYADAKARQGHPTFSIAWDTWGEVGMAVDTEVPAELRRMRDEELRRYALVPSEGAEVFRQVLRLGLPQVVVSTRDFSSRYASRNDVIVSGLEQIGSAARGTRHPRPQLAAPFVSPRDDLEELLAEQWCDNLGFIEIGVEDNYFELGGDSLKAITLLSRLQREFGELIHVTALFEAPTIAQLASYLGEYLPAAVARFQRPIRMRATENVLDAPEHSCVSERLEVQTEKAPGAGERIPAIPRREGNATFAMSAGQRRLWFLNELDGNSSAYHMPAALRIRGHLDVDALAQSHYEIIRRHETLRTTFAATGQEPVQVVGRDVSFELPVIDISGFPEGSRSAEIRRIVRECTQRPFDLAKGPLLRGTLLRFAEDDHLWVLTVHHIVSDAWSMGIFVKEMSTLYRALVLGEPAVLPELAIQYVDYAAWQADWLLSDSVAQSLAYWRKVLAGAPALLPLPWDRQRPMVRTSAGAHLRFALDPELTMRLKALGRESNGTLFTTLLAGFVALLSRYSGLEDIVVGTPTAGRNRPEFGPLIGFFVNNLMLRADVSGNPSFREHLERTRRMFLGALANQDVPFDMLVESLQPPRNLSYTPVFQVVFGLLNIESGELDWPGLTLEPIDLDFEGAAFDLTLLMKETSNGLIGHLAYSCDLFDEPTVRNFGRHFERLLEAAVTDPDVPLHRLEILDLEERHTLLEKFNAPGRKVPEATLPELFEAQAARRPDAIAVIFENKRITYRELNSRANQLACRLQKLGITRGQRVGLFLPRSSELVIGLLGILKTGAAYVPLDIDCPRNRVAFIAADSRMAALVTDSTISARELAGLPQAVPQVDATDPSLGEELAQNLTERPSGSDVAYIIYTSGSTGEPKGVPVTHGNIIRLFEACRPWFHFDASDVWTLFHSIAFDFSVWELWGALLHGGSVVVTPFWITRSPAEFLALLAKEGVTVLNQTPSAFLNMIRADEEAGTAAPGLALRYVIFGGEALEPQSLRHWFDRHGDQCPRLINMYGITETTVHVTCRPLSAADMHSNASVIGKPIADLQIYLLNAHLEPVPIGLPGEIYVGGGGVALGYLNRAGLTAERFIPNPYTSESGARLYRSGDLARRLENGDLEYLGRMDQQVKIRGFRIELGEIESVLAAQAGVGQAVVVVREDGPGGKQLVAYVVPAAGTTPDAEVLRRALRERLPDYMVPARFVVLPAFPLTANGKIDRHALPAPEWHSAGEHYEAPRNPVEKVLAEVWAEVLRLEQVGVHDNFFELGGHSLLAVQVVSRLRDALRVELPLHRLFGAPTIAGLAEWIEAIRWAVQSPPPVCDATTSHHEQGKL